MSIKPSRWALLPHLVHPDWRWFWRDLVVAAPLWEGGGKKVYDYGPRRLSADFNTDSVVSWSTKQGGFTVHNDPGTGTEEAFHFANGDYEEHRDEVSVLVIIIPRAVQTATYIATERAEFSYCYVLGHSAGQIRWRLPEADTGTIEVNATGDSVGVRAVYVGTYDGNTIAIYKDGILHGSAARTGQLREQLVISVGGSYVTSNENFEGDVELVVVWKRGLTAAEAMMVSANPYKPFELWTALISGAPIVGEVTWGHDTGVIEANIRDFSGNWTGTGTIELSGDAERIVLNAGEYMASEVVDTGTDTVELFQNLYNPSGDDVDLDYRHAATAAGVLLAGWNNYTVPFVSLGYVQVRLYATI